MCTLFSCYLHVGIRPTTVLPTNINGTEVCILGQFDTSLSIHQSYSFHQTNTQPV